MVFLQYAYGAYALPNSHDFGEISYCIRSIRIALFCSLLRANPSNLFVQILGGNLNTGMEIAGHAFSYDVEDLSVQ